MNRLSRALCLALILGGRLGVGGAGGSAAAATPGATDEAAETEALQQALRAAGAAFKAGDHATALAGFRAVEAAVLARGDLAGFRWNLARTLEALGRHAEALVEYDRALGLPDAPENQRETRQRRDTLLRTWFGALQVHCDVPGTRLTLQRASEATASDPPPGAAAGVAPAEPETVACPHTWEPLGIGTHSLEARTPAGVVTRQRVRVQPGAASRVDLALPAALTVEADPEGVVFIDGEAVGPAPLRDHPVAPGWRAVTVQVGGAVVRRAPGALAALPGEREFSSVLGEDLL